MERRYIRSARTRMTRGKALILNLTPLIDIFTILLVFLLKTFSVSFVALQSPKNIVLPTSLSSESPRRLLALDISEDGIYVEDQLVQPLKDFALNDGPSSQDTLQSMRFKLEEFIEAGRIETAVAMIRADKQTPFDLVWKVMLTARQSGIETFESLVVKSR